MYPCDSSDQEWSECENPYASKERGIDGGEKIKGRKRHFSVGTLLIVWEPSQPLLKI